MHETPRPTDATNAPLTIERVVREMTAAELEQAGIAADYWPGGPTYYCDGRELDPHERVLLPAVDPVPHCNRGRTFIAPEEN
ncbi:hypothetical protein ACFVSX_32375 [Streptomyces rubiginosohelvolus]|uniref:hypothetical protein n=1 Tax=Streptomyces rubiginosohelvolus TaxID=67362 RepID=UPI0036DDBCF3